MNCRKFFKMPYTCLILNLWTLEHHKTLGIVCIKKVIFFLNYTMEELLNNEQTSKLNTYFVGKIIVYKLKNRHALFLQDIFTSDIWMKLFLYRSLKSISWTMRTRKVMLPYAQGMSVNWTIQNFLSQCALIKLKITVAWILHEYLSP